VPLHGKEGVDGSSPSEGFAVLSSAELGRSAIDFACPVDEDQANSPSTLIRCGRRGIVYLTAWPVRSRLVGGVIVSDLPARLAVRVRRSAWPGRRRVVWACLAIGCALVAWTPLAAAFTHASTVRISGFNSGDGFAVDRSGDIFLGAPWEPPGAAFNTLGATKVRELSPAGKTVGFTLFGYVPDAGGLYL
jgi:hypothetical protein